MNLVEQTYDFIVVTPEGIGLRNEAGQKLVKTIGEAARTEDTKVILSQCFVQVGHLAISKSDRVRQHRMLEICDVRVHVWLYGERLTAPEPEKLSGTTETVMHATRETARAHSELHAKSHRLSKRPPFECIALLLQGGGALGSYQAGVYEALAEANLHPDWVAGISIGAINSAIIAGNAPAERVEKLRTFWQEISVNPLLGWTAALGDLWTKGDFARGLFNQMSAAMALFQGVANFFVPRHPAAWLHADGTLEATSFYDVKPLKSTLERLIDFDRINSGETRLSLGAVNARTGNFVYFDNMTHTIGPEHVVASGSLPPGFPAALIEGEYYWDGGLVSNTPLQWVVDSGPRQDTLAFQVDLWSARGELPRNLAEVATRLKEIQYSSRTRAKTDQFKRMQQVRGALARLLAKLPENLRQDDEVKMLNAAACHKVYNIVHLIYRAKNYEGHAKDYEFSRLSMEDHWRAGYHDAVRTLRHPEVLARPTNRDGVFTFDLARDGRE